MCKRTPLQISSLHSIFMGDSFQVLSFYFPSKYEMWFGVYREPLTSNFWQGVLRSTLKFNIYLVCMSENGRIDQIILNLSY